MIKSVIITSGREIGGVTSFAENLKSGFHSLGYQCEIVSPWRIFTRIWRYMGKSQLKILSTHAVFAAPFLQNVICVSHGLPRLDSQSLKTVIGLIISMKYFGTTKLVVCVSNYLATHLGSMFDIRVDGVIHNPLNLCFFSKPLQSPRKYITYVGRLHHSKNIHKLMPILTEFVKINPDYCLRIIGSGPLKDSLESTYSSSQVHFLGDLNQVQIRSILSKTKIFVSGCVTEAFGIAYLEALSQGCNVVMPLSGGGLEIKPAENIHTFSLDFSSESVLTALNQACLADAAEYDFSNYHPTVVAKRYLYLAGVK